MKVLRSYFVVAMLAVFAQAANAVPVTPQSVPTVPEPGSVAMAVGMGAAALMMLRRRRK